MLTKEASSLLASLGSLDQQTATALAKWLLGEDASVRKCETVTGKRRYEVWGVRELSGYSHHVLLGAGMSWRGAFISLYCRCESATIAGYMLQGNLSSVSQSCENDSRTISAESSQPESPPRSSQ